MIRGYNEHDLIERSAIEIFPKLGYTYQNCLYEKFGENVPLGRETQSEVVLEPKLRQALTKLNPDTVEQAIDLAIRDLCQDRSSLNMVAANREIYQKIRDGVKVVVKQDHCKAKTITVKVIDFQNPENNDFFLASQFWITGEVYTRRADLIGFVNGLPLIFLELKAIHKRLEEAFQNNLSDYKITIPQLFWYNAFILLSNGSQSKIGTISAGWEHFHEWKKICNEEEEGIVSLDTILQGTCEKRRFLDILENFLLYLETGGSFIKIMAKNHQYLGVNNAIASFEKIQENQGKLGVFWHTQGSGKSFSMIFFSQKILRKFPGNYTFLIVTDRIELDDQIYKNFISTGAVVEPEVHTESCAHLQKLLQENHRNIFTLIHKFQSVRGKPFPVLSTRSDIIVVADEAHRTQYDELASNMRTALPHAAFIAFTATPLIVGEERTRSTFGDYVSIYHFKQSVNDGATVPLYYEVRKPELQLAHDHLNEEFALLVEEAMLDERQEQKLYHEFAREYHLLTRESRLEEIGKDIVEHFIGRSYQGKAMVVSLDKSTAVKMYDKVQKYWEKHLEALQEALRIERQESSKIEAAIALMKETDMAVVISKSQNEVVKFGQMGLNIGKHRKRMKEDLEKRFKDAQDPFRIVFVCAKWMTGFDVPCLSTIYLDKPLRNHTLMQTIARANRVFEDKPSGMIVDYYGVFRDLEKALAIYGSDPRSGWKIGSTPVRPKEDLIYELEENIQKEIVFLHQIGIDIEKIRQTENLERIKSLEEAVDMILSTENSKREYLELADAVKKLYKAILPDPRCSKYTELYTIFTLIAEQIHSLYPIVDISHVQAKAEKLLDQAIHATKCSAQDFSLSYETQINLGKLTRLRKATKRVYCREKAHSDRKIQNRTPTSTTEDDTYEPLKNRTDGEISGNDSPV